MNRTLPSSTSEQVSDYHPEFRFGPELDGDSSTNASDSFSEAIFEMLRRQHGGLSQLILRGVIILIIPVFIISWILQIGFSANTIVVFFLFWVFAHQLCTFAFTIDHIAGDFKRLAAKNRMQELLMLPYSNSEIIMAHARYHFSTQRTMITASCVIQAVIFLSFFMDAFLAEPSSNFQFDQSIERALLFLVCLAILFVTDLVATSFFVHVIIDAILRNGTHPLQILRGFFKVRFIRFIIVFLAIGFSVLISYPMHFLVDHGTWYNLAGLVVFFLFLLRFYRRSIRKVREEWQKINPEEILNRLKHRNTDVKSS